MRQSEAKLKQAHKARQMCVDDGNERKWNLKKTPLLIAQATNNAKNTQHKLGVSWKER